MSSRLIFGRTALAVFVSIAVAGCSVVPKQLSNQEVMAHAAENADVL